MNQHDRDNLNFLLNASAETLQDWYHHVDADDIAYASELLDAYSRELDALNQEVSVELQLTSMTEYADARAALAQFRL